MQNLFFLEIKRYWIGTVVYCNDFLELFNAFPENYLCLAHMLTGIYNL